MIPAPEPNHRNIVGTPREEDPVRQHADQDIGDDRADRSQGLRGVGDCRQQPFVLIPTMQHCRPSVSALRVEDGDPALLGVAGDERVSGPWAYPVQPGEFARPLAPAAP